MSDRDLKDLLEQAAGTVPVVDLADEAWRRGRQRRQRAWVVGGTAAAVGVILAGIGVLAATSGEDAGTQPAGPPSETPLSPEPISVPESIVQSPALTMESLADLPLAQSGLPATLAPPPDSADVAADPPGRAVVALAAEDGVYALGTDGDWRGIAALDGLADRSWIYRHLVLSPDGSSLAAYGGNASPREVSVVDLGTGETATSTVVPGGFWITSMSWFPDSRRLLLVQGQDHDEARVLDTETGETTGLAADSITENGRFAVIDDGSILAWYPERLGNRILSSRLDSYSPEGERSPVADTSRLGTVWSLAGSGDALATRLVTVEKYESLDPTIGPGGVLVLSREGQPQAFLPTGSGMWSQVLGWDPTGETVYVQLLREGDAGSGIVAWTPATGALSRVADSPGTLVLLLSLTPDLLR